MTTIDTSTLAKFGNMTSGGGLGAIFDGTTTTTGYAQDVCGFAGIFLACPTAIQCANVSSAVNGFDASGATSTINLRLYGKTGSLPPASATDGTLLGSITFTDANTITAKTIPSNNTLAKWDFVWVSVQTGVWAVLSECAFVEATQAIEPAPYLVTASRTLFTRSLTSSIPLMQAETEMPEYRVSFQTGEPRVVSVDLHADFKHIGSESNFLGPIGFGLRVFYRSGTSLNDARSKPFQSVPNAVGGGNIINRSPHHYGNKTITVAMSLPAGVHEFYVLSSAHTDAASHNGLGEIYPDYNQFRVAVEAAGTVLAE